jgi:hypothetical protein
MARRQEVRMKKTHHVRDIRVGALRDRIVAMIAPYLGELLQAGTPLEHQREDMARRQEARMNKTLHVRDIRVGTLKDHIVAMIASSQSKNGALRTLVAVMTLPQGEKSPVVDIGRLQHELTGRPHQARAKTRAMRHGVRQIQPEAVVGITIQSLR